MSKTVSREKYESIKHKAESWRDKVEEVIGDYDNLQIEYDNLEEEYDKLQDKYDKLSEEMQVLTDKYTSCDVDENIKLRKDLKLMSKKVRDIEENYKRIISDMDRDILKKDVENNALKASLDDYKERYKEYREEVLMMRKHT
jgi:chromosome segregation ATPase